MDPSQSPNDDVIVDESITPKIGINITPCEDLKSSTSDLSSEQPSPSKFKLPISITDLWRIRRKEKLKKRFLAKSLRLANDDVDDDSDSYSFDHDSLATPSINTSQIDPSMDSDNGDYSWSSGNSPGGSRSSSMDSASPEESWGSPPYINSQHDSHGSSGNSQRDSHGSSEDLLSQGEYNRRTSVCTIIDRYDRSPNSFSISNPGETSSNIDTIDKQLKIKGSECVFNSEASSDSPSNITDCTVDENEEFKQIMKNMTIASFSNKKINAHGVSDESIEEPEEQFRTLSNILDPIDLLSRNSILSTEDTLPSTKSESISVSSKSDIQNTDNSNKIEEKDDFTNVSSSVTSKRDIGKLKSPDGNNTYRDKMIDNKNKNLSTKENPKLALNKKESKENVMNTNEANRRTEINSKNNKFNSTHEKRSITQSLEFKRIEKTVGLGIDKSCFWCCEIL